VLSDTQGPIELRAAIYFGLIFHISNF
jgi:hypothetical protein